MPSNLLHNRWFGKLSCAILALAWAPADINGFLLWIAIALGLGHSFDIWSSRLQHPSQLGRIWRSLKPKAARSRPFMEFTFAAIGRLAKCEGQVLPIHIDYVEDLMQRLTFNAQDRHQGIQWFVAGKAEEYDFGAVAQRCLEKTEDADTLKEMALECMCVVAHFAPGPNTKPELGRLTLLLGATHVELQAVLNRTQISKPRTCHQLSGAFETLGVSKDADLPEIKLAYRRLIAQCHPDRLGPKATKRDTKQAEKQLHKTREAYELILAAI